MESQLVNITEQIVDQMVDDLIKKEKACPCPKCRLDIMALALNKLPPKYVVSVKGNAFTSFQLNKAQNRIDFYQAIWEAVQKVKGCPQHE